MDKTLKQSLQILQPKPEWVFWKGYITPKPDIRVAHFPSATC